MRKLLYNLPILALTSCALQTVQNDVAKVDKALNIACTDVELAATMAAPFAAVPTIGTILAFASGSCAGGTALAALADKAVHDPTTIAWTEDLATKLKGAVAKLKQPT